MDELGRSATSGVRWSFVAMTGRHLGRLAFALLLARLLGPENYGIIGQATVYLAFTALLLDQGFGAALIQRPRLDRGDIGSVLWLNVVSAVILALGTVAAAPAVARFFDSPELVGVLRVLAAGLLFKGVAVVPTALLTRGLRFRALAMVEVAATVFSGVAGTAVALGGGDYWALVVQALVLDGLYLAGVLIAAGLPEVRGSLRSLRQMWGFSSRVMGSQLLTYGSRNVDNLIIARVLGATALAYYSIAYRVLLLPLQMLTQVVSRVAYPVLSRLQDDRPRMKRCFLHATRAIAMVAFPAMTLVIVAAPDAVPVVLGPSWNPAVVPMQILALTAMRQSVLSIAGNVFMACGRADWQFRFSLGSTALLVTSFAIGVRWGIAGVAVAYGIADALLHPLVIAKAGQLVGLRLREYAASLVPGTVTAIAFGATWLGARLAWTVLVEGEPGLLGLAASTLIAATVAYRLLNAGWPAELAQLRGLIGLGDRGDDPASQSLVA